MTLLADSTYAPTGVYGMFKIFGRVRRLAVLALLGSVWFFRDSAATAFDQQARDAQQVISEKFEHEQHQQQSSDQKEVIGLLSRILLEQARNNPNYSAEQVATDEDQLIRREAHEASSALSEDAEALKRLLPRVEGDAKKMDDHMKTAEKAIALAKEIQSAVSNEQSQPQKEGEAAGRDVKQLLEEWEEVSGKLGVAWTDLEASARHDQEDANDTASLSRAVAWIGSLISALLVGDWRKAFGMVTSGGNPEENAASAEGTEV